MTLLYPWPFPMSGLNPPAPPEGIDQAEEEIGLRLPADLREFYAFSNGFDGDLDAGKAYLHINDLEELVALSTGYDACVDLGGLIIFAGTGGNHVYVVDTLRDPPVYAGLSLFASDRSEMAILGDSFGAFLQVVSQSRSPSA